MDLSKLNNLTIIKKNKDPLVNQSIASNVEAKNPNNLNEKIEINDKKDILFNLYKKFRNGKLSKSNLNEKLQNNEPKLIENISNEVRTEIILVLSQTLKWLLQIKLLLSTGKNVDNLNLETFNEFEELGKNKKIISDILSLTEDDTNVDLIALNPKEFSLKIKSLLKVFTNDDIINPKYKTDKIINYLHNERPMFLNEIATLFDLYSKYYKTLSKELLTNLSDGNFNIKFQKIKNIQPRFNMINKHILLSNLSTKINFNLDLKKIGALPENPQEASKILGISASQFGLKKRLDNLNEWLTNGIIMIQVSINRIYALKPLSSVAVDGSIKVGLKAHAASAANKIYDLWLVLEDIAAFLDSLKGLIDGSAFLTGVPSEDMLEILEINY